MAIKRINAQILEKVAVADDVYQFTLGAEDGELLPAFSAGAHIDLYIDDKTTRQYSLINAESDRQAYRIGVLRDGSGRGGSVMLCDEFDVGSRLQISEPRNLFPLQDAEHYILIAGGIGVTPIYAMAKQLASTGRSFEFHYLCRSRSKAAFCEALQGEFSDRFSLYLDDTGPRFDASGVLANRSERTRIFTCGPAGLISFLEEQALAAGWSKERVHYELFSAGATEQAAPAGAFELVISGSGEIIMVDAEESALDALLRSGFEVDCSCEQGVCGSCVLEVIEGEPDHRDMFLTDAERAANRSFTPCCSRALSPRLTVALRPESL